MSEKEYLSYRRKLGNRIKKIRTKLKITQEGMEEGKYPVKYRTIQDVENLETDIRLKTLYNISKSFGMSLPELLDL